MKKYMSVLLVSMCLAFPAHADWDEAAEQREKAEQAKADAEQKAIGRKMYADNIRDEMKRQGIDTRGKSDDQVIQEFEARNAKEKAEMEQTRAKGMNDMRKELGAAADGKSDDEVMALYAAKKRGEAVAVQQQVEANRPQLEAATKQVTGKSMDEIMNMSDEELDRLADEMEKKYGE